MMMKRAVWGSALVLVFAAALWAGAASEALATDVKFPGAYSTAGELAPGLFFRGLSIVNGVVRGTSFAEWDKSGDAGAATYIAETFPCPNGSLTCPEPADLPPWSNQAQQGAFTFRRLTVY